MFRLKWANVRSIFNLRLLHPQRMCQLAHRRGLTEGVWACLRLLQVGRTRPALAEEILQKVIWYSLNCYKVGDMSPTSSSIFLQKGSEITLDCYQILGIEETSNTNNLQKVSELSLDCYLNPLKLEGSFDIQGYLRRFTVTCRFFVNLWLFRVPQFFGMSF